MFKKAVSMLLALCMAWGLAAPAFAGALLEEAPLEAASAEEAYGGGLLPGGEAALAGVEAPKQELASDIYYDGKKGKNTNDGLTANTAVAPLSKALELLAPGGTLHFLTGINFGTYGAVTTLENITIVREPSDYKLALLQVNGGTLNLNNVTVDGNRVETAGALVEVANGTLNINGDTRLINSVNVITDSNVGGYGGGIYAYKSTINLNGGEICGNSVVWESGEYAPAGGGIYAWDSTVNLKNTKITGNSADGNGGGIFMGQSDVDAAFTMTGGEISGNKVTEIGYSGAGIYAWNAYQLFITGGTIRDNTGEEDEDSGPSMGTAIMLDGEPFPTLSLSGSPVLSGEIFLWEWDDEGPVIQVPGTFTPGAPVLVNGNHPDPGRTAVRYAAGLTPNLAHFLPWDEQYGLAAEGQDIQWVKKYTVSFKPEDNGKAYKSIYVMPGAKISASDAPAPDAPTTGLYLAGWRRYNQQELWNFDENTADKDMMTLLAAWGVLPPQSVGLKAESGVIYTGSSVTLTASAVQENPDASFAYEWYKDGQPLDAPDGPMLKATEEGSYTVKVRAKLDGRPVSEPLESAAVALVMRDPPVPDAGLTLDKTSLTLAPGKTAKLTAALSPADATYKVIFWTSSDEAVAAVSDSGVVTALAEGKATITAQSWYGSTAVCEVTVKKADDPTPPEPESPWPTEGLEGFVTRCYRVALGREPDKAGHADWVRWLQDGTVDAKSCAYGFVFSKEMNNKRLSDEDFVKALYRLFMDREGEAEGVAFWQDYLKAGHTRLEVFGGFADSKEFAAIKASYGLG